MQKKTKNGRAIVDKDTKLPVYDKPIELRLINIRKELNEGLSKEDSIWNNILNSVKLVTTKGVI